MIESLTFCYFVTNHDHTGQMLLTGHQLTVETSCTIPQIPTQLQRAGSPLISVFGHGILGCTESQCYHLEDMKWRLLEGVKMLGTEMRHNPAWTTLENGTLWVTGGASVSAGLFKHGQIFSIKNGHPGEVCSNIHQTQAGAWALHCEPPSPATAWSPSAMASS